MREPAFDRDGWCLDDGEDCHRAAPETFSIPDLEIRKILQPGDFAKLIFRIAGDSTEEPEAIERMWVIVRERTDTGYLGILDNNPSSISENATFWSGAELPFEYRHIISVQHANDKSIEIANALPPIPWDKSSGN